MTDASRDMGKGGRARAPRKHLDALRAARLLVAAVGGYFAVSWTAAWAALVLIQALGMQRGDAVILMSLLAILGYGFVVVWIFAHPSAVRALGVLLAWCLASVALTQALANTEPSSFVAGAR